METRKDMEDEDESECGAAEGDHGDGASGGERCVRHVRAGRSRGSTPLHAAYEHERKEMYERIEEEIGAVEWREVNGIEDLDTWLLRDMKCDSIVRNYLDIAFTKRKLYFH
jgi:hypothetical protein